MLEHDTDDIDVSIVVVVQDPDIFSLIGETICQELEGEFGEMVRPIESR